MEKSFASLLRHSKLATYDRCLNQVYSSPKHCKQRGDWGLKRNLPTVIRTPFVTVGQLDTLEHQTPWDSGHSQVAFIQRWKENFGDIASSSSRRTPQPSRQPHDDYHNLTSMTRPQFDHFIKHTITPDTAQAFHQALKSHQITRDQVYDYLHVTFRPEPSKVMGPIYNNNPPAATGNSNSTNEEVVVQGRILNTLKGGYAVGIGGVVALLPKRFAVGIKKPGDRWMVRSFYVRRAYIDDQGKPQVIVSLHPQPTASTQSPTRLNDMVSSPTSALPTSTNMKKKKSHRSALTLDRLFASPPLPKNMDDLQLSLLGPQSKRKHTHLNTNTVTPAKEPPPPSAASASASLKEKSLEDHSVLMNRIIALLKNGASSKKD
ncbi:hypothetical protein BCR42DRAFT_412736 [Absidia repens]|uniref:Uncharacterized protein n=1 Tax=Absidia repens TaxID=90262 RepID=A0A1X2ILN2_9FUNG|nr:hypothetical protein BCR42DRAFT_412736 [Absidia repens]